MATDVEGCTTEHVSADDFLVPDETKINLFRDFDVCAVKRRFSMHELWKKIKNDGGSQRGWNKKAVLNAMRYQREAWRKKTEEQFTKDVAEGNITLASHLKEHVDTYILFIKEFDDSISKYIVLRDYAPALLSLTRRQATVTDLEEHKQKTIKKEGFLFAKQNYAEDIRDVFSIFMDCAGSGMWHRTPSLAEKIFVQCRQYDFTMNAIMDAVKINMSLILQASTPEASEKIKSLVFGPHTIIPSEIPFVQQRFALPTQEATNAVQFMMLDMFRGIGEYRVHEKGTSGAPPTATQSQLDAAEAAKLSGTQLRRYNGQHTFYYRRFYKRLVNLKSGEKDYELFKKFKEYLDECGVPKEAWKHDNIKSITSNMLAGAGSPSYKLMAAEKTIALTNVSAKDEGQAKAVEDALAALHGRSNVSRYVKRVKADPTFNERMAGYEDSLLANPFLNPGDVQVQPDDNDVHHLDVHFFDMERTITLVNEKMKQGSLSEFLAETAAYKLLNQGGHCMAHIERLKRDEGKQEMVKIAVQKLNKIQRMADKLAQDMQAAKDKKQQGFDPAQDPDVAKKIAMSQLEVDTATKLSQIKVGAIARNHEQRMTIDQEKASNQIAINRATELDKLDVKKKVRKRTEEK